MFEVGGTSVQSLQHSCTQFDLHGMGRLLPIPSFSVRCNGARAGVLSEPAFRARGAAVVWIGWTREPQLVGRGASIRTLDCSERESV